MAPTEIKEQKEQLEDLLEKECIHLSLLLWGAPILFIKKKDGTMWMCINYC